MGQPARYPCGHCGTLNNVTDQFCANCGYLLSGGPTGTVPAFSNAPTIASTSPPIAPTVAAVRRVTGALTVGELLGGRYRNLGLVGQGGFGAVYKASDERFKSRRTVAIKEMSDANLTPVEKVRALDDFRQEADLLVQLKHSNLPDVSDFLEEGGKAYLVMEFVEGKTLEKIQEDAGRPLDEKLVMGWALQLCDVLAYLHSRPQPIIFRDLKPSNVMVTNTGQIKLIDFGIARIFKSSAAKDTTTLGSRGYAPLEQYGRGQSDPRSDIYALGATLYDLMTNSVPADAPTRRVNPASFVKPRQANPAISKDTERIILKAMADEPKDRYQSASAMFSAMVSAGFAPGKLPGYTPTQINYATIPAPPTLAPTLPGQAPTVPAQPPATNNIPATLPAATTPPAPLVLPGGASSSTQATISQSASGTQVPTLSQQPAQAPTLQQTLVSPNPTPPAIYPPAPVAPPPASSGGGISRRGFIVGGLVAAGVIAGGGFAASRILGGGGGGAPSAGGTVQVDFTFSTEKAGWLEAALAAFNNSSQVKLAGSNKTIQVVLNDSGSLDVKDKIVNGLLKPVAWSPANDVELRRLSYAWTQTQPQDILYSSAELAPHPLVSSPLVMAVWKSRADAFISTYGKIDWDTLHTALLAKNGWGATKHPEWGSITLGHTRPDLSNSGLLSIMLMAYAYIQAHGQNTLTKALVDNDDMWTSYIKVFDDVIGDFGDSSLPYFTNTIIPEGPSGHSITFTYENLVLLYQNEAQQRWHQPLQIYYPSQGTISGHPFAILNAPWVSSEQVAAAKQFRDFLLSHEQQRQALQYGFRPFDPGVHLNDNGIPNNPFKQLAQLSPAQTFDPQTYTVVREPQGDAVDELIARWKHFYPNV
jgi:serine/threonine protein kinase